MYCEEIHLRKESCKNSTRKSEENLERNRPGDFGGNIGQHKGKPMGDARKKGTNGKCTGNVRGMQHTNKCHGVTDERTHSEIRS